MDIRFPIKTRGAVPSHRVEVKVVTAAHEALPIVHPHTTKLTSSPSPSPTHCAPAARAPLLFWFSVTPSVLPPQGLCTCCCLAWNATSPHIHGALLPILWVVAQMPFLRRVIPAPAPLANTAFLPSMAHITPTGAYSSPYYV